MIRAVDGNDFRQQFLEGRKRPEQISTGVGMCFGDESTAIPELCPQFSGIVGGYRGDG